MRWLYCLPLQADKANKMERYTKQILLPGIGKSGQQKLADAKILVIGAGGLGSVILPYLAASGIGYIGIIDGDFVEESNLQRQVIYTEKSLKKFKVVEAAKHLKEINSQLKIDLYTEYLTPQNALSIIQAYDLIVDATDNMSTRYLINDSCIVLNKVFVYGAVYKYEGQVSVFNYKNGPTYRCLFPEKRYHNISCNETGVLGTNVGIIGMLQANEVLKIILGIGEILSGKLLTYNLLNNSQNIYSFNKDKKNEIDIVFFHEKYSNNFYGISIQKAIKEQRVLIDIREKSDHQIFFEDMIIRIPYSEIDKSLDQLNNKQKYAVFCQNGIKSKLAADKLKKENFDIEHITDGIKIITKNIKNEKEKSIY